MTNMRSIFFSLMRESDMKSGTSTHIIDYLLDIYGGRYILYSTTSLKLSAEINMFIKEIITIWFSVRKVPVLRTAQALP